MTDIPATVRAYFATPDTHTQHALAHNGDCQWTCPHPDHARHDMSGETQRGIYGHRIAVCPACGMKVCVDCDVKGICRPRLRHAIEGQLSGR